MKDMRFHAKVKTSISDLSDYIDEFVAIITELEHQKDQLEGDLQSLQDDYDELENNQDEIEKENILLKAKIKAIS